MHHALPARTAQQLQLHLLVSTKYRDMMAEHMEAGYTKTQYLLTADALIGDTQRQLETLLLMETSPSVSPPLADLKDSAPRGRLDHAEAERILLDAFGPPTPAPAPVTAPPEGQLAPQPGGRWRIIRNVVTSLLSLGRLWNRLGLPR